MSHVVYVISDLQREAASLFKVGKHTGSEKKLKSRYKTYGPNPIIRLFAQCPHAAEAEQRIFGRLRAHRAIDNETGRLSEWIRAPLEIILRTASEEIAKVMHKHSPATKKRLTAPTIDHEQRRIGESTIDALIRCGPRQAIREPIFSLAVGEVPMDFEWDMKPYPPWGAFVM